MKLIGKIIIKGNIKLLSGLHIGGSSSVSDIGGIDSNVVKSAPLKTDVEGTPYIPGSSLKGKLRTLLAKEYGWMDVKEDQEPIIDIFGSSVKDNPRISRLIVADTMLNMENFRNIFNQEEMELEWTEGKWENRIDRKKGSASDPRQLERVPAGAVFDFMMIYDVYDDNKKEEHLKAIGKAIKLLEDDYLGGSGTRGYGRVKFTNVEFKERTIVNYYANPEALEENDISDKFWH